MAQKLGGKVAVVTGASKGIGASIATHMAAEGAAVVVNYASSKSGADRVVSAIEKAGGKAVAVQADVSKQADVETLFSEAVKAFGKVDVLVNNAGIYEFSPLENITAEHFHKQFNLNVLGLLLACQQAAIGAEASSTSARSCRRSHRLSLRSTAARRPPSMRSRSLSPRNWERARSA